MSEVLPSSPPPPKSDRVAVVVNGNARHVTADLVEVLDQIIQSGDLFVSRNMEEGREIAKRIVQLKYPIVLTGGGDGTFVQMVTWIVNEARRKKQDLPRFGLLKLGTGNALAWVLGAENTRSGSVFADIARLRQAGGDEKLKLIDVEGKLTPFAGAGADALMLQHYSELKRAAAKLPLLGRIGTGTFAYALSATLRTAPEIALRNRFRARIVNEGAPVECIGDDGQPTGASIQKGDTLYEGTFNALFVASIPYAGFGARVFPFAEDRPDRFHLRIADIGGFEVATHLRSIWKGTYRNRRVHDFFAESISIYFDRPTACEIGGDPIGKREVLRARIFEESIRVVNHYAPPSVA